MADREHTKQPVEETRPVSADAVPDEEDLEQTDVGARAVDTAPEEHLNRPDQPDFDPAERAQYDDPPVETSLADADHPEDH
ncbi:hypothetical protein ACT8ZV_18555 [Nocardioides sp. MAHUQ-72]|uniref:hypothetical protein n=1 Tax=unclassified Nocardioides TaxID=2615069 RepID=UPI00361A5A59